MIRINISAIASDATAVQTSVTGQDVERTWERAVTTVLEWADAGHLAGPVFFAAVGGQLLEHHTVSSLRADRAAGLI